MIRSADENDRPKSIPIAPTRQEERLVLGSSGRFWHGLNNGDAESLQLPHGQGSGVVVLHSTLHEFSVDSPRRLREKRDAAGKTPVHEVCCLQHPGALSVHRYNDDIYWLCRIIGNQRASGRLQQHTTCVGNRTHDGNRANGK